MKKSFLIILSSCIVLSAAAQEKKVKTGWKFDGGLPATTFDSDLGLQYGALVEFSNSYQNILLQQKLNLCYNKKMQYYSNKRRDNLL